MELLWYIHTKNYITEKNPQNNHKNKYRKQIYQQPTNSETRKRENIRKTVPYSVYGKS